MDITKIIATINALVGTADMLAVFIEDEEITPEQADDVRTSWEASRDRINAKIEAARQRANENQ